MTITTEQNAVASDFINKAGKNATPANDAGRVPKLETDGKLHSFFTKNGQVLTAGATINGATLPVPVYQNKTDNKVYACDGNDTSALKFIGFATSNSTNTNPIDVQFEGVVGGFSGLDEGEKYYLQDTAGTIGTTVGTYEVLVGVAISTTELFIKKGKRYNSGTVSWTADTTTTVTLGFRVSRVRVHILATDTNLTYMSNGGWTVGGGNDCVWALQDSAGTNEGSGVQAHAGYGNNNSHSFTVDVSNITDTTFNLVYDEITSISPTVYCFWEAEGEQ